MSPLSSYFVIYPLVLLSRVCFHDTTIPVVVLAAVVVVLLVFPVLFTQFSMNQLILYSVRPMKITTESQSVRNKRSENESV